jgi:hypothetical protein
MPRFVLKELFTATMLVAAGLWAALFAANPYFERGVWFGLLIPQALWLGGGALIGAGALSPFKRKALGASLGIAVQVVVFTLMVRGQF